MRFRTLLSLFAFTVLATQGAEFDLGSHGTLSLTVPTDWRFTSKAINKSNGTPSGIMIVLGPQRDAASARGMLTMLYATNGAPNKDVVRKDVLRIADRPAAKSVEKQKTLKEFSLEQGYGAYCVFTDASLVGKTPKAGEFKVLATGEVQPADNLVGVVTLFANELDGAELKAMIKIINTIKVKPKAIP